MPYGTSGQSQLLCCLRFAEHLLSMPKWEAYESAMVAGVACCCSLFRWAR